MTHSKLKTNAVRAALLMIFGSAFFFACSEKEATVTPVEVPKEVVTAETYSDTNFVANDWTVETHSNKGTPNFDLIFNDKKIQRLDLVITKNRWQSMLKEMTTLYGAFGSSGTSAGGGLATTTDEPTLVPAEVFYGGKEWYRVGVRFKGNSSLQSTWRSGNMKLSFKLDFDEFEDNYKQIDNQRFYGFKKLSLKNNFDDKSFLREKVAGDVFRNAGLAGSHTAFYTVYVDFGDGPVYFGLYTLTEEVDDTVISKQFKNNKGNLYKPDGAAASFANGSFNKTQLEKKTNEDVDDWTDIQNLFAALHDGTRTTDAAAWRKKLEAVFDTDVFLKYLAVNTTIQNWDTYGRMTHNYYLYNNPKNNLLTWIPWDNNEALQLGKNGGSHALNFSGLTANQWPLIGYLYQDPVYKAKYNAYLKEVIDGAFKPSSMQTLYSTYATLVEPYATTEKQGYTFLRNTGEFSTAINTLKSHVSERSTAVETYLK